MQVGNILPSYQRQGSIFYHSHRRGPQLSDTHRSLHLHWITSL